MLNWRIALVLFGLSLGTQPGLAQQADVADEEAITAEPAAPLNLTVTSTRKPRRCGETGADGEILVCGKDNGEDVRVPTDETNTNDGLPRAPQLDRGSCKGQLGCIMGGWAPPPIYYIDVKSIPVPPKGSDADKVANGEIRDR